MAAVEGDTGTVTYTPVAGEQRGETRTVDFRIGSETLIVPQIAFSSSPVSGTIDENTPLGRVQADVLGYVTSGNPYIHYGVLTMTLSGGNVATFFELEKVATGRSSLAHYRLKVKANIDFETTTSITGNIVLAMAASQNATAVSVSQAVSLRVTNVEETVEKVGTPPDFVWRVSRAQAVAGSGSELALLSNVSSYFREQDAGDTLSYTGSLLPRNAGDVGLLSGLRIANNTLYGTPRQITAGVQTVRVLGLSSDGSSRFQDFSFTIVPYAAAAIGVSGGGVLPGEAVRGNVITIDIPASGLVLPTGIQQPFPVPGVSISNPDGRPLAWRNLTFESTDHIRASRDPQDRTLITSGTFESDGTTDIDIQVVTRDDDGTFWTFQIYTTDQFTASSVKVTCWTRVT